MVGVTVTAVPLVAERLPGVITPVPPANTAVNMELDPASIVAGFAAKLEIAAFTVTVVVCVIAVPVVGVTVSV